MYEFFEDESVQLGSNESDPDDCFHDDELKIIEWQNHLPPSSKEKFARAPCDLPSWPKTVDPVDPDELSQALDQPAFLRLIFVSARFEVPRHDRNVRYLVHRYGIPSTFVSDLNRSTTHGCGAQRDDQSEIIWCHFLCKDVETLQDSDGNYRIFNPRTTFGQQSHRNTQYRRFGAFIRRDRNGTVTLVSFGGLHSLYKRFKRLVDGDGWKEVLQDPHALLVVLLEEYARFLDERVWRLMEVLRSVEPKALAASQTGSQRTDQDFTGLHYIAKHIVVTRESCDAAIAMTESVHEDHSDFVKDSRTTDLGKELMSRGQATTKCAYYITTVHKLLSNRLGQFKSINVRLQSMEKRSQNVINLSFHIVNQQDSHLMLEDSAAVMAIGVFTFLMLPATTLGSIFGAQFFSSTTDSSSSGSNGSNNNSPTVPFVPRLQVASNFWIFWACVIPITTVSLVFGWRLRLFFLKRRQRISSATPTSEANSLSSQQYRASHLGYPKKSDNLSLQLGKMIQWARMKQSSPEL